MKKQYTLIVKPNGQDVIKASATRSQVAQHVRAWRKNGVRVVRSGSLVPIFPPEVKLDIAIFYFPAKYL